MDIVADQADDPEDMLSKLMEKCERLRDEYDTALGHDFSDAHERPRTSQLVSTLNDHCSVDNARSGNERTILNDSALELMPLVDDPPFESSSSGKMRNFVLPRPDVRLTDAVVYEVLKAGVDRQKRSTFWPYDFDTNGNIRPKRVPSGSAVIHWANGISFVPVWDGYYAFVGDDALFWLVDNNPNEQDGQSCFYLGRVILEPLTRHWSERQVRAFQSTIASSTRSTLLYSNNAGRKSIWITQNDSTLVPPIAFDGWNVKVGPLASVENTITKTWCNDKGVVWEDVSAPYNNNLMLEL